MFYFQMDHLYFTAATVSADKTSQVKSSQFYLYSAKSQQKLSHDTLHVEQVKTVRERRGALEAIFLKGGCC